MMIQYIPDTTPHVIVLNENRDNMKQFLEEMTDIYIKYEVGKFGTPDGKLYQAILIKKTETNKTTRITHQHAGKVFSWNVEQMREIRLEYHFTENEVKL